MLTTPPTSVGTKQWYTVPLSILAHAIALCALIVIPLMATGALPTPQSMLAFSTPPPTPPPPPPPPPAATTPRPVEDLARSVFPVDAPDKITPDPPPPPVMTSSIGVPGGIDVPGIPRVSSLTSPPPAPPPPPRQDPVHVGGDIKQPKQLKGCEPVYPAMAVAAKVQGMVIVEAVIDKNGNVKDAHILKHQALLDEAALEAVRCRKYSPTLLNGIPIEVIFTVTVNFQLGGG